MADFSSGADLHLVQAFTWCRLFTWCSLKRLSLHYFPLHAPKMKVANLSTVSHTIDLDALDNTVPKSLVLPRTRKRYGDTLKFWEKYRELHPTSVSPPDIQTFKGFLLWYARCTWGRLEDSPAVTTEEGEERRLPTRGTMESFRRNFLTAWDHDDRPPISCKVATSMKAYIITDMVREAPLSTAEMSKPCFSPNDLTAVLTHLWCSDALDYRGKCADRSRVALSFALLLYCFTSARTGEVHESTARRGQARSDGEELDNLQAKAMAACYKHFTLTVEVVESDVMLVLTYERVYVKGGDKFKRWELPIHAFYEVYTVDQPLMFNLIMYFIALASADGAFQKYACAEEVLDAAEEAAVNTSTDHENEILFVIKLRKEISDVPLFRPWTELMIEDATGRARGADSFGKQFANLGKRTGYSENVTARGCRRWALMEADRHGTETTRMKFGAHRDPKTYARSYAHPLSELDGPASFLDIPHRRGHITNRRGMGINRDRCVWQSLPAKAELEFETRPDIVEISEQIESLEVTSENKAIELQRRSLQNKKRALYLAELKTFQKTHSDAEHNPTAEPCRPFYYTRRVMPERDLLARVLPIRTKLRSSDGREAVRALETLCRKDTRLAYRKSLAPINGKCVCGIPIDMLHNHRKWLHLYRCIKKRSEALSNSYFAELCFECDWWFHDKNEWIHHCQWHFDMPENLLRCDPLMFRNALIKPGYCPFCMGDSSLAIEQRMEQFLDKSKWHDHVENHLQNLTKSFNCEHPACSTEFNTMADLRNHLWDWHYHRPLRGRKRKGSDSPSSS